MVRWRLTINIGRCTHLGTAHYGAHRKLHEMASAHFQSPRTGAGPFLFCNGACERRVRGALATDRLRHVQPPQPPPMLCGSSVCAAWGLPVFLCTVLPDPHRPTPPTVPLRLRLRALGLGRADRRTQARTSARRIRAAPTTRSSSATTTTATTSIHARGARKWACSLFLRPCGWPVVGPVLE